MTLREKIAEIIDKDRGWELTFGDALIPTDAILSIVREALREEAGKSGDEFICGGCLMDVCKLLGEE